MDLAAYWEALRRHDWFYERTDDPRVYDAGAIERGRLSRAAALSPEHGLLWACAQALWER